MATPRVFISSTWYDLRYIRENLKYFVRTVGYEPILSEEGSVFYDPRVHVQDACLGEIPNTQMFILIIGGRYGSEYHSTQDSVTNHEYREAVRLKLPIFALVEQAVYNDFQLYQANCKNAAVDASLISYPSADSTKIFAFIDEVRSTTINNALVPFRNFTDIEAYLRQQWAGMMFSFLLSRNESERVADTLSMLRGMSERVEMLSRQILESVGTKTAKVTAELYDKMLEYECARDLAYIHARPTPQAILLSDTFPKCVAELGTNLRIHDQNESSIDAGGGISRRRFEEHCTEYGALRAALVDVLKSHGLTVTQYLDETLHRAL
jgi:hypothetical protein